MSATKGADMLINLPGRSHYGNKLRKCVKFKYFFYLRVIIGFFNLTWNANQQGTLINDHGQVDPFRNYLIRIFVIKA